MPTDYCWTNLPDENEIDRVSDPRIIPTNGSLIILANSSANVGTTSFTDFAFPLDYDAIYTIGSDASCNFFLPTVKKDTMKIYVDNYVVLVSESHLIPVAGSKMPEIVVTGGLIELKENMRIRFGLFTLVYIRKDMLSPLPFKRQLKYGISCQNCGTLIRELRTLDCGHIICTVCVDYYFLSQMGTSIIANVGISDLFNFFRCRLCRARSRFTDIRRSDLIPSSLVDLLKLMTDFSKSDIMCSSCRNSRVFISPEDFYECRTCLLTLCSICSLSNFHRTHDVASFTTQGTARLCKTLRVVYAIEQKLKAILSRKKEFHKSYLTTKGTLRICYLKLKGLDVGLRSKMLFLDDSILRLGSISMKCAHANSAEMDKECDEMIENTSKRLHEDSKIYDESLKKLDRSIDAVLKLLDDRLPSLLFAGKKLV